MSLLLLFPQTIAAAVVSAGSVQGPTGFVLTLEGGPMEIRLAERGCTISGVAYKGAIVAVQTEGMDADLEAMNASPLSATITLSPDVDRFLDPMTELAGLLATLSIYDGKYDVVRTIMQARVREPEIGTDGDPHVFTLLEEFSNNPDFPPTVFSTPDRIYNLAENAEGLVYQQVFGNAFKVPCPLIGPYSNQESIYLLAGHDLATDPCPYNGFPQDAYPDEGGLVGNTVTGEKYGDSAVFRDNLRKATLAPDWTVVSNASPSVSGVTLGLVTPADGEMRWTGWFFRQTISFKWRITFTDANARHIFKYGWTDTNNYTEVKIDKAAGNVTVRVFVGGSVMQKEVKTADFTGSTSWFVIADVRASKLTLTLTSTVATGDPTTTLDFGQLPATTQAYVTFGATNGRILMDRLQCPALAVRDTDDMNAGIQTITDLLGQPFTVQRVTGELDAPLYATFRNAQKIKTAGLLWEKLLREFSDYEMDEIDERTLQVAIAKLGGFVIGAYFNEQQPIIDLLTARLGKQFGVLAVQQAGLFRTYVVDPLGAPEAELRFGRELIDHAGPAVPIQPFTHLKAKCKYNPADNIWSEVVTLNPQTTNALLDARIQHGPRHMEALLLSDVVDREVAEQILVARASLFYQAADVSYLQEVSHFDDDLGRLVLLTDEARGFDDKRAILTSKVIVGETPDFAVLRYRTFEPLPVIG